MEVIRLCRLCLTSSEYYANIFFEKIKDKELWRLVNSVCELNTFLYDGLPEHICVDCVDTLKKTLSFRNRAIEATSALKLMIQKNKDLVPTEEEIDVEEWQMPKEWKRELMDIEGYESELHINKNIVNVDHGSASSKVIMQGIDLPVKQEQSDPLFDNVDANQSTRSSDLKNFPILEASEETARISFECRSSSICTSQDNSIVISDTNKTISEKDLRVDVVPEEESSGLSKSVLNDTKSELSHLKSPLSKRKIGFICDICKTGFKSKRDLGNHLRVHNDERPFSCNVCEKTFKRHIVRYQHELRHMRDKTKFGKSEKGSRKKQFSCTVCGMYLYTKKGLQKHSNLHRDKYKCNTCGRPFGNNVDLRRHLRTHTKEKPFKCEVCFKCFNQKGHLNIHLHTHSSDKPFSCDICEKRFKTNAYKVKHELFHFRKK